MLVNRVLDIDGVNEVQARNPLAGLFSEKGAPLSLHQCFLPIQEFFSNNDQYAEYAHTLTTVERVAMDSAEQFISRMGNGVEPANELIEPLSLDESAAIYAYTFEHGLYRVLNTLLRDKDRKKLKPFVEYLWLLMHALRKCPIPIASTIYRGIRGHVGVDEYSVGKLVIWSAFSSCTTLCSVLSNNAEFFGTDGNRTLFHITLTTNRARSIAHMSVFDEAEVLLPPNTKLRVFDVSDLGNGMIAILLEEEPSSDPILPFELRSTNRRISDPTVPPPPHQTDPVQNHNPVAAVPTNIVSPPSPVIIHQQSVSINSLHSTQTSPSNTSVTSPSNYSESGCCLFPWVPRKGAMIYKNSLLSTS